MDIKLIISNNRDNVYTCGEKAKNKIQSKYIQNKYPDLQEYFESHFNPVHTKIN